MTTCNWYWGSHGCGFYPKHKGIHACEDCSEFDSDKELVRFQTILGWTEWLTMKGFQMNTKEGL